VKGDDLQQDVEFERYRESLEFQIKQVDQIQKALGVFAFGFLGTTHTTRFMQRTRQGKATGTVCC
jgi:hypothetical protein